MAAIISPFALRRSIAYLPSLLLLCGGFHGAGHIAYAEDATAVVPDEQKLKKDFFTAKDRLTAMKAAALFRPHAISEADLLAGPEQDKKLFHLRFNDKVICDFATPGSQMSGNTPKFECKITRVESPDGQVQTLTPDIDEKPVKVKFGADDNELYAEVAATRLMWALGYYADAWYSVRVECHNCPENPVSGNGSLGTRMFAPATIVRKFSWKKMTESGKEDQGWSWKELDASNGRPTYERDGLKLLAAFLQHGDNKPPQQRLTCHHAEVDGKTQPPTTTCDESVMLVQDVGATFGGAGLFTSNGSAKMNLGEWAGKKVWKHAGSSGAPASCQATLRKSFAATDGLGDPAISEEGRRFDANLLCQLSDKQIEDLFKASNAAAMPEYHNKDGSFKSGVDEASVVRKWVDAFKRKREDLAAARCEWKEQPADLSVLDNPMKLSTVPNFCSAKPF